MKDGKKTRRQVAAAKLLEIYANLAHSELDCSEMLLQHAFLDVVVVSTLIGLGGTDVIGGRLTCGCWNTSPRMRPTLGMSGPQRSR
jgi:hypothetical protein